MLAYQLQKISVNWRWYFVPLFSARWRIFPRNWLQIIRGDRRVAGAVRLAEAGGPYCHFARSSFAGW
jgi:hypothetical protein